MPLLVNMIHEKKQDNRTIDEAEMSDNDSIVEAANKLKNLSAVVATKNNSSLEKTPNHEDKDNESAMKKKHQHVVLPLKTIKAPLSPLPSKSNPSPPPPKSNSQTIGNNTPDAMQEQQLLQQQRQQEFRSNRGQVKSGQIQFDDIPREFLFDTHAASKQYITKVLQEKGTSLEQFIESCSIKDKETLTKEEMQWVKSRKQHVHEKIQPLDVVFGRGHRICLLPGVSFLFYLLLTVIV